VEGREERRFEVGDKAGRPEEANGSLPTSALDAPEPENDRE